MKIDHKSFRKIFSTRILQKAIMAFDTSMATVVIACWLAAFSMIVVSLYTVHLSVVAKKDAEVAAVGEPSLPQIVTKPLTNDQIAPLITRLQRQFPDISFVPASQQMIGISTNDGSKFRLWLTVLSYIDTISPEYRWVMSEFCVGLKCGNSSVMRALLKAESISFTPPKDSE